MSWILPSFLSNHFASSATGSRTPSDSAATPLVGDPRSASVKLSSPGPRAGSSACPAAPAARAQRLRGRFVQTSGQFSAESVFGTAIYSGKVLSVDPRLPRPQPVPLAVETGVHSGGRFSSATRQLEKNTAMRIHAARMVLGTGITPARARVEGSAERTQSTPALGRANVERMASLFPGAGPKAFDALQLALHQLEMLEQADRTAIGETLAQASGGNVRLAHEILERLSLGIDLYDSGHVLHVDDQAVERGMWRAAQLLSRTDAGFQLLQSLQPVGVALGRAARIILQVGDHCMADTTGDPVPDAFQALVEEDVSQRQDLPASVRRAAYRMLDPARILSTKERGLIFAWEQGFRRDGPGTPLHAVKLRLEKFTHKSIPRVEASRWRSFARRVCGSKKSPLSAMQMGMHGANRKTLVAEHAQARQARHGSIQGFERQDRDLRLSRPDRIEAAQLLDRLITNMQSSSRVRFADGGRRGLSLKGLTIGLSNFLHTAGVPLGLRLNLSRSRAKRSVIEIAQTTGGGEIMFGRETRRQNTIGVGVIAGYDFNAGLARLRCGLGVDATRTREVRRASGVILRVAQRARADGKGPDEYRLKTGMRSVMRFLFEESACQQDASPDAVFDRFAGRFFDDPDVSLGSSEQNSGSLEHSISTSASLTANIAATGLRIGPTAALIAGKTAVQQHGLTDAAGRLQVGSFRMGAQTDIAFAAGIDGKIGGTASDVGLLHSNLTRLTVPLHRDGQYLRARLLREHGRLQAHACTLDLEFTNVDDYVKALKQELSRSSPTGSRKPSSGNLISKESMGSNSDGVKSIAAHVTNARYFARDNQTFVIRKRLDADVARVIDRNAEAAQTIRGCDHLPALQRDDLCEQLDAESTALLAQADSWVTPELKVMERSGRLRRHGLSAAFQLASESQAEGERCLASLVLRPLA